MAGRLLKPDRRVCKTLTNPAGQLVWVLQAAGVLLAQFRPDLVSAVRTSESARLLPHLCMMLRGVTLLHCGEVSTH